ncbi:hypothetical protein D3C80_1797870 [compost metagenome]
MKSFSNVAFVSFQTSPEEANPGMKIIDCFPFPVFKTSNGYCFVCAKTFRHNAENKNAIIKMIYFFIFNSFKLLIKSDPCF